MSKSGIEFGGGVGGNSYVVCLAILIAGAQLEGLFFDLGYARTGTGLGMILRKVGMCIINGPPTTERPQPSTGNYYYYYSPTTTILFEHVPSASESVFQLLSI